MTKSTLLLWLDEVASKIGERRAALEQLPETEDSLGDRVADPKSTEVAIDRFRIVHFVDKEKLRPIVDNAFAAMGVCGEPLGAETVQEMMAAGGVRPEDNILSRGIIDMHEE
jgi:hypothetical protein